MMKKYLATLLLTIGLVSLAMVGFSSKRATFYETITLARLEKKLSSEAVVNVYVYSETCTRCRYLKEKLKVGQLKSKIYGLNLSQETDRQFLKNYQIVATPLLLKLSKGGAVLERNDQVVSEQDVIAFFDASFTVK